MDLLHSTSASKDDGTINPLQLLAIVRSASGAFLAQASLHAQLAQVEWEEEKQRLAKMFAFTLVGFACFLCLIFFTGALTLAIVWDTPYRIPVFIFLLFCYAGGLVWAGLQLKALSALSEKSFAATRAEIAADVSLIKSVL
jgi:uncharacterized membrane protein YqjE